MWREARSGRGRHVRFRSRGGAALALIASVRIARGGAGRASGRRTSPGRSSSPARSSPACEQRRLPASPYTAPRSASSRALRILVPRRPAAASNLEFAIYEKARPDKSRRGTRCGSPDARTGPSRPRSEISGELIQRLGMRALCVGALVGWLPCRPALPAVRLSTRIDEHGSAESPASGPQRKGHRVCRCLESGRASPEERSYEWCRRPLP